MNLGQPCQVPSFRGVSAGALLGRSGRGAAACSPLTHKPSPLLLAGPPRPVLQLCVPTPADQPPPLLSPPQIRRLRSTMRPGAPLMEVDRLTACVPGTTEVVCSDLSFQLTHGDGRGGRLRGAGALGHMAGGILLAAASRGAGAGGARGRGLGRSGVQGLCRSHPDTAARARARMHVIRACPLMPCRSVASHPGTQRLRQEQPSEAAGGAVGGRTRQRGAAAADGLLLPAAEALHAARNPATAAAVPLGGAIGAVQAGALGLGMCVTGQPALRGPRGCNHGLVPPPSHAARPRKAACTAWSLAGGWMGWGLDASLGAEGAWTTRTS